MPTASSLPATSLQRVQVQGLSLFYREAGPPNAPAVLLLHGFPTSSHMFRHLIPKLATRFRVVAPDLPGFGFSDAPDRERFRYTFDHLSECLAAFTDAIGLQRYALYVFDYGAPVGLRLACARPQCVSAIVSQNGNAYEEGLSEGWAPLRAYWNDPTPAHRDALRGLLTLETTQWQYTHGTPDPQGVEPEAYWLDHALMQRPGNDEIQLDLFADYASNLARYPEFQAYFERWQPPLLAVWGRNDPFFLPEGAQAFRRHLPNAQVHLLDTGHFALETHGDRVFELMMDFLSTLGSANAPPANDRAAL